MITLKTLSEKQKIVLKWAHSEKYRKYGAIICDGAVRSGKTVVMTVSFVHWAMRYFDKSSFAIAGKTISSTERNIITPMQELSDLTRFYDISYSRSNNLITIKGNGHINYFYVFGGKDESSYMLIQGMTLCGMFFDEVALMPRSFVEQGIARTLSVKSSKLWFNCNPEHPEHWFYKEWILDSDGENRKKSLHLHFEMTDNPILGEAEIEKAKSLYSGVFKDRYIYGKWVAAEGLVYPMFGKNHITEETDFFGEYYISIDYGTANPCSMGLWVDTGDRAVRLKEFYYDSKEKGRQLTDEEYYNELDRLASGYPVKTVVVDPSAASFIQTVKRHRKFNVRPAKNNVIDGIRLVCDLLKSKKLFFHSSCKDSLREFSLYRWDEKATADTVKKEYDHAMDEIRYFCFSVLKYKSAYKNCMSEKADKKKPLTLIEADDLNGDWGY